jgi:hypothetical protein
MKSKSPRIILLGLLLSVPIWMAHASVESPLRESEENKVTQFSFYNSSIQLRYSSDLIQAFRTQLSEKGISSYYKLLKLCAHEQLLAGLLEHKNRLGLNDWLFYKLIYQGVSHILQSQGQVEKELLSWFLLSELGYDTRLTYLKDRIFVYVYSMDTLFEIPLIKDGRRTYANLTSFRQGAPSLRQELFLLQFRPRQAEQPFSFYLEKHPVLPAKIIDKQISFPYKGREYLFPIKVNQTIVEIMEDYPYFSESQYLEVPLSSTTFNSLIPQLKKVLAGKSRSDAVQLLAAFTRSSFEYKEDKSFFGKSKPMIADEVLYYPYSDCEDRSALFYQLVKTLLDLPMVAIAYEDHLTIGVYSQELKGDAVWFKGKPYYICDPTGPANSDIIGKFPLGYENKSFDIIGYYK